MENFDLSWNDFNALVEEIAEFYEKKGIKRIIGLVRGGLPLAVSLSHKLNIPMDTVIWQSRDSNNYDIDKLLKLTGDDIDSVLFVDDICDSGLTINAIKEYIPLGRWCTLTTKQRDLVEFSPVLINNDRWITFPWEK